MANNLHRINRGISLAPQTSVPASPVDGDVYYDSGRGTFTQYIGGSWTDVQSRTDVPTATDLTSAQFNATVVQSSFIRLTGSTTCNVDGLLASSDAKMVILYNESSAVVTIVNNSGTEATATNRIVTPTGANMILSPGYSAIFIYDGGQSRWVLTNLFEASLVNPMTQSGDIIYGASGGTPTRLPANSSATKMYLQSVSSGTPTYQQVDFADLSGNLSPSQLPVQYYGSIFSSGTKTNGSTPVYLSATSGANGLLSVPAGTWRMDGFANFTTAGGVFWDCGFMWAATPGNDTTSVPTALTPFLYAGTLNTQNMVQVNGGGSVPFINFGVVGAPLIVTFHSTFNIYFVPYAAGNGVGYTVSGFITAQRIG